MTVVSIQEARERFPELLELIAAGEEVIIKKGDQPFARLSPLHAQRVPRVFGSAKGLIQIADDFDAPLDDFAEYQ
jgi:antitoxin (DNA-binding transcriptional repressor) of toxin-antitoxin stability system